MSTRGIGYAVFVLALVVDGARAGAATVSRMTTAHFGNYFDRSSIEKGIAIASRPYWFYLSDGSMWPSGAGTHSFGYGKPVKETVVGDTIRYEIQMSPTDMLMRYTDYSFGDHSSQGQLDAWGPLEIVATLGSKVATLTGYALIVSNEETWYGEPRFNFYDAPVGWAAPMTVTYTLATATWQPGIFSTPFDYRTNGEIRFTEAVPVPEPGAVCWAVALGVGVLVRRRGRGCAR